VGVGVGVCLQCTDRLIGVCLQFGRGNKLLLCADNSVGGCMVANIEDSCSTCIPTHWQKPPQDQTASRAASHDPVGLPTT
jgi:hypothetical protein